MFESCWVLDPGEEKPKHWEFLSLLLVLAAELVSYVSFLEL